MSGTSAPSTKTCVSSGAEPRTMSCPANGRAGHAGEVLDDRQRVAGGARDLVDLLGGEDGAADLLARAGGGDGDVERVVRAALDVVGDVDRLAGGDGLGGAERVVARAPRSAPSSRRGRDRRTGSGRSASEVASKPSAGLPRPSSRNTVTSTPAIGRRVPRSRSRPGEVHHRRRAGGGRRRGRAPGGRRRGAAARGAGSLGFSLNL